MGGVTGDGELGAAQGVALTEAELDLRLARLHLRVGLLGLARAELEAAAGLGTLDRDGLADLAAARWRSGDLAGAGIAAEAHLAAGGDALVARVVAAEARYAEGRLVEAEEAARAAAAAGMESVRALFAGLPASDVWAAVAEPVGRSGATGAGAGGEMAEEGRAGVAGDVRAGTGAWADRSERLAEAWVAVARKELAAGRREAALVALGLALRADPAAAALVLETLAGLEGPSVQLVRGDALRALGRTEEARLAYEAAEEVLLGPAEPR